MHPRIKCALIAATLVAACARSGQVTILDGGSTPPPVELTWTTPKMVLRTTSSEFRADTAFLVESPEEWTEVRRASRVRPDSLHPFDFDDGPILVLGTGEQGATGYWVVIDSIGRGPEGDVWVVFSGFTTCTSIYGISRPIAGVQLRRPVRSIRLIRGSLQRDRRCGLLPG